MENSSGNGSGSKPRPPSSPALSVSLSLSIYQPPPGANGPQTAVSPGSSEAPGVARRVWWSSIPANVRPTRPQFIRHLPSPSALENCSESSPLLLLFFFLSLFFFFFFEGSSEGSERSFEIRRLRQRGERSRGRTLAS